MKKNHDFPAMNIKGYQTKVAQRHNVRYVWEYAPQKKSQAESNIFCKLLCVANKTSELKGVKALKSF